jgi:predicted nucleic acid-binding protein
MNTPQTNSVLPLVLQLRSSYPALQQILQAPFQLNLIIDTNVILGDMLWMLKKRRDANAKTEILELLQNKMLFACAPSLLKKEIKRHIPAIAKKEGLDERAFLCLWKEYERYIEFLPYKTSQKLRKQCERDPNDAPFLALQMSHRYPIHSKDKDMVAMGGKVINARLITDLKEYSRNAEICYSFEISGIGIGILTISTARAIFVLLSKIPKQVYGVAAVCLFVLLLNQKTREPILKYIESNMKGISVILEEVVNILSPCLEKYNQSRNIVEDKKELITGQLAGQGLQFRR